MSIAPPSDRLNAILARHDIITATLNAGPDPETFVSLSRELAELDGVVEAIRAYRAMEENLTGPAGPARRSLDRCRDALARRGRAAPGAGGSGEGGAGPAPHAAAQGRGGREERHPRNPRRHRRRRGRPLRRRPAAHVHPLRRPERLEGRDRVRERGHGGRLQGSGGRDQGPRRVRAAQVRERRPPGPARAGHGNARAHPHLRRHRRRAAGGRGRGHRASTTPT